MIRPSDHASLSGWLEDLCLDGRTPGDREIALVQVSALVGIAQSMRWIANSVEPNDHLDRVVFGL